LAETRHAGLAWSKMTNIDTKWTYTQQIMKTLFNISLPVLLVSFMGAMIVWYYIAIVANTDLFIHGVDIFSEENALKGILVVWPFTFIVSVVIALFTFRADWKNTED